MKDEDNVESDTDFFKKHFELKTTEKTRWVPKVAPWEVEGVEIQVYDPKIHGRIRFRVGVGKER